jgi:site-specific recombinase XerD
LTFSQVRYGPAMTADYRPSLVRSFERHLRAENRSEHTVASYLESLRQAEAFLAGRGRSLLDARREDLEAFLGELLQHRAPETVATRYRRLRVLYRWLEEEDEIPASPMARMKPPIVPDQPVPVVPEDGLRRLLGVCAGKDFEARRDTAIVMFLLDTGARRGELADLEVGDLSWTWTWPSCSARAAASVPCPMDARPPWRWTATCASAPGTRTLTFRGCGLASVAG